MNQRPSGYEYDIWGNKIQETVNSFDNPFRYCSEYMDEESGLIYLRTRYYDPNTGRFTQEDPAMSGFNWYIYGNNNPVIFFDPEGLDAKDEKVLLRYIIEKNGGRCEYNENTGEVEIYCNGHYEILGSNTEQIVGRTVVTVGWIMDTFGLNKYQASHQSHERFNTELEAVIAAGFKIQRLSLENDWEYGCSVYQTKNGYYAFSEIVTSRNPHFVVLSNAPNNNESRTSTIHSHGRYSFGYASDEVFSSYGENNDMQSAENRNVPSYLFTPAGRLLIYTPYGRPTEVFEKKTFPYDPNSPDVK